MSLFSKPNDRKELAKKFFGSAPYVPDRREEIQRALEEVGKYEETIEWRISTSTELNVEPISKNGKKWYRVNVKCDHEFTCHTPTIERAAQFLRTYEQLIADMFYELGWPSWASRTELGAEEGAA